MAFYEQIIIGQPGDQPGVSREILAASPGISEPLKEEILRICMGWGQVPPLGLESPALVSQPLQNRISAIRGRLHVVIRVTRGDIPLFHALVMSSSDFGLFLWNPYKLLDKGLFLDRVQDGTLLQRERVEPDPTPVRVVPGPSGSDQGLIDEALSQFLSGGKLSLPLEQPDRFSDRAFALLISLIPVSARQGLKFASFATQATNNFTLAGMEVAGSGYAGWHRLLVSQMGGGLSPVSDKYVSKVRQGLQLGSLESVYGELQPDRTEKPLPGIRNLEPVRAKPSPLASVRPTAPPPSPKAFSGEIPEGVTGVAPGGSSRTRLSRLTRQPMRITGGTRGKAKPVLATFLVLICLGVVGWGYFMGVPEQIRFLRTGGEDLQSARQATSLLEVVNVGQIYTSQLKKVNRAAFVPGLDAELVRGQAQATLQAEAAGPLLKQADLFLQLVGQGIQQGRRPDRETARMKTLAQQGQVLRTELFRLELAWHSLDKGVGWVDLERLDDAQVKARRDSLTGAAAKVMAENRKNLGTTDYWKPLNSAVRQVDGMQALLALFQRKTWSVKWEKELYRAAEQVSPTASPMTRAYRNSAFTLVRLKRAERMAGSTGLPYVADLQEAGRPAAEVQDILPSLRRQVGKFADGEAPDLLAGLLSLYQVLGDSRRLDQDPAVALERVENLRHNYAYKFDAEVYEPYLERLGFEVLHTALTAGATPESLPPGSYGAVDRQAALEFHAALNADPAYVDWDSLSRRNEGTFLGRWSGKLAASRHEHVAARIVDGDASWRECRLLLADLKQRVAVGADWTSVWVDLHQELALANSLHRGWSSRDPDRGDRLGQLNELTLQLEEARSLQLETVTIRLAPEVFDSPGTVILEFQGENSERVLRSASIPIGPASPEGSGWVGTGYLDFRVNVSPLEAFTGRVRAAATGDILLEIPYPSLADRVGPGGVSRLRAGTGGSLQFRCGDSWWRSLHLTDLVAGSGTI